MGYKSPCFVELGDANAAVEKRAASFKLDRFTDRYSSHEIYTYTENIIHIA